MSGDARLARILADGALRLDEPVGRYGYYVLDGPDGSTTIVDAGNPDLLLDHAIRIAPSGLRYRDRPLTWGDR
jgi:hypothetical protein